MKKSKIIKIGKKKYLWEYEKMDARLITGFYFGIALLSVAYIYMGLYIVLAFAGVIK